MLFGYLKYFRPVQMLNKQIKNKNIMESTNDNFQPEQQPNSQTTAEETNSSPNSINTTVGCSLSSSVGEFKILIPSQFIKEYQIRELKGDKNYNETLSIVVSADATMCIHPIHKDFPLNTIFFEKKVDDFPSLCDFFCQTYKV